MSFGLVETVVATVLENNPTVVFKHENPAHNELDEIYNDAFSYTWRRSTLEFYDFLCDVATYGKGYWYEFYRKEMGEQEIPIGFKKNKDGIVTSFDVENLEYRKEKVVMFDDVYGQNVSIDDVWLDDTAKSVESAEDCFIRYAFREDAFKHIFSNFPRSKGVTSGGNLSGDVKLNTPFSQQNLVEVYYYYNKVKDKFIIWAGGLPIHEGPIPYLHKSLPLAEAYWKRIPDSKWGIGIPQMVEDQEQEMTDYRRGRVNKYKLEVGGRYIMSSDEGVDQEDLSEWGSGMAIAMDNPEAFKAMPVGNALNYSYRDEDGLKEDIVRQTGIDWRDQGVQQGNISATEVLKLGEATRKRLNLVLTLMNRYTMPRIAMLRLQNINQFWSLPKYHKVVGKDEVSEWEQTLKTFKEENPQYRESDY